MRKWTYPSDILCDFWGKRVGVDDLDDIGRDWTATMSLYDISDGVGENEKISFVWAKCDWEMMIELMIDKGKFSVLMERSSLLWCNLGQLEHNENQVTRSQNLGYSATMTSEAALSQCISMCGLLDVSTYIAPCWICVILHLELPSRSPAGAHAARLCFFQPPHRGGNWKWTLDVLRKCSTRATPTFPRIHGDLESRRPRLYSRFTCIVPIRETPPPIPIPH